MKTPSEGSNHDHHRQPECRSPDHDSADPAALADFWGKALGRPVSPGAVAGDTAVDATSPDSGPRMILHHPAEPGTAKNSVHLVLITDHYDEEIERLTGLGARPPTSTPSSMPRRCWTRSGWTPVTWDPSAITRRPSTCSLASSAHA